MMNHHVEAVARARPRALLVADLPYLSYHVDLAETIRNAGGFLQRGAAAVKLEGGAARAPTVRALAECEIPVMGHLGLTPQSLHAMGGFKVQGRAAADARRILDDARRLEEAGCFSLVLEGIPAELAARITERLTIPTIGIGAGPAVPGRCWCCTTCSACCPAARRSSCAPTPTATGCSRRPRGLGRGRARRPLPRRGGILRDAGGGQDGPR